MTTATLRKTTVLATLLAAVAIATAIGAGSPAVAQSAQAEPADPWRYVWRVTKEPQHVPGLDCTFFASQAFNQTDDHYASKMAQMCAMLSEYKKAVITSNSIRFRADYIERESVKGRGGNPVPQGKRRGLAASSDSGKYLIAREIGLIDALAAAQVKAGNPALD
ncbi:MAG: hypothetical protein AAFQ88_07500 [Pseudomonadota bacterium]